VRNRLSLAIVLAIVLAIFLGGASALVPGSTAFAARHEAKKLTGACAQASGRCVSDCDALNWCHVYTCVNGQSTPVPFWRCFQPSGLCLAPHC
jgi:hypothetical protein